MKSSTLLSSYMTIGADKLCLFRIVNNVSILLKHFPYKEDPRHPVHYIHQASYSYQDLCYLNPAIGDRIFGDLISDNKSTYTFNEAEFDSWRVAVVSNLTSNKNSGVDINDLTSRLGVFRATSLRTLEATTQRGVRKSNFFPEGRRLISRHDRLHCKRLHDQFYSDTIYVRPKFQSLHRDSCVQFFSTKYHFTWAEPMAGDTGDHIDNTLLLFTQQVGVPDEIVNHNHQNVSGSGTNWA